MFNIRLMRNILVLAEQKNFAKAAKALNISQPTLSRSIQSLEEMLGTTLFERSKKGAFLTQAGEMVCKHARLIIASAEAMKQDVCLYQGLMIGSLSIAVGSYAGATLLADVISQFSQRYPKIEVAVDVVDWASLGNKIMESDFDFVIMESSELSNDAQVERQALHRHQAFFFCRRGHPIFEIQRISFSDIVAYTLVMTKLPERIVTLFDHLQQQDSHSSRKQARVSHVEMGDQQLIVNLVSKTDMLGVGTLGMLEEPLRAGAIKLLPLLIPRLCLNADIIVRKGLSSSPAALRFLEILKQVDAQQFKKLQAMMDGPEFKRFTRYE